MRWAAAWRGGSWTPDAGAAAKLVANPPLFGTVGVLAEALALAQLIAAQAERRREAVKANDYPPRFTLALAHKDANLVSDAGTDLRIAQAARSWLADADAASWASATTPRSSLGF